MNKKDSAALKALKTLLAKGEDQYVKAIGELFGQLMTQKQRHSENVKAGLDRARKAGKRLGRRETVIDRQRVETANQLGLDEAAQFLGVSRSTVKRWRQVLRTPPLSSNELELLESVDRFSVREAGRLLGVSSSVIHRRRQARKLHLCVPNDGTLESWSNGTGC